MANIRRSEPVNIEVLPVNETTNINVPACRFYIKHGCKLGEVHRFKYIHEPERAHEVALIWYLDLTGSVRVSR